ncbi:MAG TPA: hypothetical protein PLD61_08110, partial [Bacillota bacterium]|nr:hypothetical protein [Bacillota bacterium]
GYRYEDNLYQEEQPKTQKPQRSALVTAELSGTTAKLCPIAAFIGKEPKPQLGFCVFLGFVAGGTCVMIYFHLKEQPECESKNPRDSETLLREVQKEKENRSIPRGIGVSK